MSENSKIDLSKFTRNIKKKMCFVFILTFWTLLLITNKNKRYDKIKTLYN